MVCEKNSHVAWRNLHIPYGRGAKERKRKKGIEIRENRSRFVLFDAENVIVSCCIPKYIFGMDDENNL